MIASDAFHRKMRHCRSVRAILVACLTAFLMPAIAMAQAPATAERPFNLLINSWSRTLDRLASEVERKDLVQSEIDYLRGEVQNVRQSAQAASALAREDLQAVRSILAPLEPQPGPPGPDGKPTPPPPESDAVRVQREQLAQQAANIDGRIKQAEAVTVRADQLLQRLTKQRETMLLRTLTARGPTPLSPTTWRNAGTEAVTSLGDLAAAGRTWLEHAPLATLGRAIPWALGGGALLFGVYLGLNMLRRHVGRRPVATAPSYRDRVLAASVDSLGMVALPIIAVAMICFVLLLSAPPALIETLIVETGRAMAFALLVYGITETGLAPAQPAWRVMPFSDRSADILSRRLQWLAWVLAAIHIIAAILVPDRADGTPVASVFTAIGTLATLLVGLPPLRTDGWQRAAGTGASGSTSQGAIGGGKWALSRMFLSFLPPIAVAAALFGYSNLAVALLYSSVQSLLAVALALVLHALVRDLLEAAAAPEAPTGRWLRRSLGLAADADLRWRHVVLLFVDLAILIALCIVIPTIWGVELQTLQDWASRLLTGLKVGGRVISLLDVGLALLVFALAVLVAGALRRGLRDHVLPTLAVPDPVRYTVDAGFNYAGLTIAFVLAIVALGVDFSSLALILGALSVGIGLGLQGLVNNMISGVVLLLERPIRVGDRISVSGFEGIVRRVNIRATEIETFEHALVIMPNSQLLQSAVVNATYADFVGRIELVVVAAIGSDVAAVERIMMEAAEAHEQVARYPKPVVLMQKVIDGGIEIELRVWLRDRATAVATRNELGQEVLSALAAAGITLATRRFDAPARPAAKPSAPEA